ncbi:hypothetical protein MHYP_G00196170 [Metynnis hypsauchen]
MPWELNINSDGQLVQQGLACNPFDDSASQYAINPDLSLFGPQRQAVPQRLEQEAPTGHPSALWQMARAAYTQWSGKEGFRNTRCSPGKQAMRSAENVRKWIWEIAVCFLDTVTLNSLRTLTTTIEVRFATVFTTLNMSVSNTVFWRSLIAMISSDDSLLDIYALRFPAANGRASSPQGLVSRPADNKPVRPASARRSIPRRVRN